MKQLTASILLLLYFTVSTGFVVSVHYCMDKVDSIELGHSNSDKCGKCGMVVKDSEGCCKNEVKVVKMQVDQAFAKLLAADFSLPLPAATTDDNFSVLIKNSLRERYPLAHGPPLSKQDTYLQNCVFRL